MTVPALNAPDVISEAWVDAVAADVNPSVWTNVTFQNAWVNFGGVAQAVQYRKENDRVWVRGICKTGVTGSIAWTFPVGFRPPATQRFPIEGSNDLGSATITNTGTVTLADLASTANVAVEFSFSTLA